MLKLSDLPTQVKPGGVCPREITRALGGDWHGAYGLVPGPGHSPRDRSLSVKAHPTDPNDVLLHSFSGDDWRRCKAHLRELGLLPPRGRSAPVDPEALERRRAAAEAEAAAEARKTAARVEQIISETVPIAGTPADDYLQSRGIRPPFPRALRFHPGLWTQGADGRACWSAAMIGIVTTRPGGAPVALHRTFLTLDGRKNPAAKAVKAMLGPVRGGAVWPDAVGQALAIGEGIETALSFQKLSGIPTAAALAAGFLEHVLIPRRVTELTFAADDDPNGVGAQAAIEASQKHWLPKRQTVVVIPPGFKDFNDQLQSGARHG